MGVEGGIRDPRPGEFVEPPSARRNAQAGHQSAMSVPTPDTVSAIGTMAMAEHQA